MNLSQPIRLKCDDGLMLGGDLWKSAHAPADAFVVINGATGVLARYYHRYARFLSARGFDVLTYDYRGIGASRPMSLRGCGYRWRDWGTLDCEAALRLALSHAGNRPVFLVGHSIGGILPGFAESSSAIARILTVGAQFAWWYDYAEERRARMFFKWHVLMPALTYLFGFFPGKRLGWLEDLPAGVANEWTFRRSRLERSFPLAQQDEILARFAAITAPILAVRATDDELATRRGVYRGLSYFPNAHRQFAELVPEIVGQGAIGHMGLFNERHRPRFWLDTLTWLKKGINPFAAASSSPVLRHEALA